MNRKNIDNVRYVDLDEFIVMEIIPIQFIIEGNMIKEGFRVDGITKNGLRIESLYVEKQDNTKVRCEKFIADNWVNAKK